MDSLQNRPAVWPAAKRGALLGVYVSIAVSLAIIPFSIYALLKSPSARADLSETGLVRTIGGFVAGCCLMAVYLAVTGAIIMGIIAFVRSRRRT